MFIWISWLQGLHAGPHTHVSRQGSIKYLTTRCQPANTRAQNAKGQQRWHESHMTSRDISTGSNNSRELRGQHTTGAKFGLMLLNSHWIPTTGPHMFTQNKSLTQNHIEINASVINILWWNMKVVMTSDCSFIDVKFLSLCWPADNKSDSRGFHWQGLGLHTFVRPHIFPVPQINTMTLVVWTSGSTLSVSWTFVSQI